MKRAIEEGADAVLMPLRREQHDPRLGAWQAKLDPTLFYHWLVCHDPESHLLHSLASLAASCRLQSHALRRRAAWAFRSGWPHSFRKFYAGITLPPIFAMSGLPMFRFSASGLVPDEGFEAWREIMARMFHIDRRDRPERGGAHAARRYGRQAHRSALA